MRSALIAMLSIVLPALINPSKEGRDKQSSNPSASSNVLALAPFVRMLVAYWSSALTSLLYPVRMDSTFFGALIVANTAACGATNEQRRSGEIHPLEMRNHNVMYALCCFNPFTDRSVVLLSCYACNTFSYTSIH